MNQKKIGIFTYPFEGVPAWDPDSILEGISGSEEAVIYMADELTRLNYEVYIIGNPPPHTKHSKPEVNPRYIYQEDLNFFLDIAISWRVPFKAPDLRRLAYQVYLWPHDSWHQPLIDPRTYHFDDVLWLSHWQREQWISVIPAFDRYKKIFGNGIETSSFGPISPRVNPYSCIYASNYGNGLEKLLEVWPRIKLLYPLATLDIYYGWQHWGLLTAQEEGYLRHLVHDLKKLDVNEHGKVSHFKLNEAFEKASFWTYPCHNPEAFCITALRAQYAGAIPVVIKCGALSETVQHGYQCSEPQDYLNLLLKAFCDSESISIHQRHQMRAFIDRQYRWSIIAKKWQELFENFQRF